MGCAAKTATCVSVLVVLLAVLVGLLVAGVPTNLGFWSYLARGPLFPAGVGLSPAFLGDTKWGFTHAELLDIDLSGQRALVTGANSGLGYQTSLALARQGAHVVLACRTSHKCEAARMRILNDSPGAYMYNVTTMHLDTSKLAGVRASAEEFSKSYQSLDMLFLNAGIAFAKKSPEGNNGLSEDGVEMVFATNVLGHHLLYSILEPLLMASSPVGRVVLTSSAANYNSYDYGVATDLATLNAGASKMLYGQSKLAQVLWAQELTRRLGPDSSVYVNSCHPGAVDTGIWAQISIRYGDGFLGRFVRALVQSLQDRFMWSPAEGALTQIFLGAHSDYLVQHSVRGRYFHPQSVEVPPNTITRNNIELQKSLWEFLDELVRPFVGTK